MNTQILLILLGMLSTVSFASIQVAPDFAREVRPILEKSCFGCHGPDKQKSGYRLDVRDAALKGGESGKRAIVPHDAKNSRLMHFVSGEDAETVMPPLKSDVPRLTLEQVETLRAWIDAGPSWPEELAGAGEAQPQWSLQPLVKPAVPGAEPNSIDAFIHAKLTAKQLTPSPEADRRTLIRRLSYDLTGLPPTPEEADAFAADPNPQAYDKLVARLLASPRYGERWARHWLDTVHFADSHGFEHDLSRDHAWPYRDYVIAALNNDTPWPRFIREQLAADVFFPEEPRLRPALGFLGAGPFDVSAYNTAPVASAYLDRDDMVTQTISAFASATVHCARCHNHKFDPISQEDYYALQAVFAGVTKGNLLYDEDAAVMRARRRWGDLWVAADKQDAAVLLAPENAPLVRAWQAQPRAEAQWRTLEPETLASTGGSTLARGADGIVTAGGTRPDKDTYTITARTTPSEVTALRLEVLASDALPMHGPGRQDNGNLHLSEFAAGVLEPGAAAPRPLKIQRATADFNQKDWGIERAVDDSDSTAWGIHPAVGQSHHAVFVLAEKLTLAPEARLIFTLKQLHGTGHLIGALRLSATNAPAEQAAALPAAVAGALAVPEAERTEPQRLALAAQAILQRASAELSKLPPRAYVFAAGAKVNLVGGGDDAHPDVRAVPEPKVVNVLLRGDFDKPRAVAEPGALSGVAVAGLPARFALKNPKDEAERRAALADWLAHPGNPLTWRSIVNRVWHHHFGRGLCDTPDDFGKMGGSPSHVELLDWLAVWFRDDACGSLKELHRLIVTSATYRQASAPREDGARLDGDNRLLWRQNRLRLDADAFRDFTLAAAGKLDLAMGGPGVRQFKSGPGPQMTPSLDYAVYDWNSPGAGRRSIYRHVWRAIPDPFMEALDFPDMSMLAPARGFSVSALQALTLYNNSFVLHQSEVLARRVESEASTLETQVARLARLIWLRELGEEERHALVEFAQARGLPALCRLILNSNEFLFVN